mmetsp:Transcript_2275/g.3304  ORF Transcript_2275/g.3304 Transcript_2275/m.3304 type:complete len:204 (+) Transcript_2275:64-675(+)
MISWLVVVVCLLATVNAFNYSRPGRSQVINTVNKKIYSFGGIYVYNNGLKFNMFNDVYEFNGTHWNELYADTYGDDAKREANKEYFGVTLPEGRILAKIEISQDGEDLFISGGSYALSNLARRPLIKGYSSDVYLQYEPTCIFNDLWKFNIANKTWTPIILSDDTVFAAEDRSFLCHTEQSAGTHLNIQIGLLCLLFTIFIIG